MEFNGFKEFMNTAEESSKWHKGFYRGIKAGLKRHDPRKIRKDLMITDQSGNYIGYKEWFGAEGHYHDVPYLALYLVSTAAELGALGLLAQHFGVPF